MAGREASLVQETMPDGSQGGAEKLFWHIYHDAKPSYRADIELQPSEIVDALSRYIPEVDP